MSGSFVTDDLTTMFDEDELAEVGTIGTTTVNGYFNRDHRLALEMVSGANPVFLIPAATSAAAVGSSIVISGTTYTIRDREPLDDGALVKLQLEAA